MVTETKMKINNQYLNKKIQSLSLNALDFGQKSQSLIYNMTFKKNVLNFIVE